MERASITKDVGQESTLMYAIGKQVKAIGGIYVISGLILLLGPGREVLLNLDKVPEANIVVMLALYYPIAGIAILTLGVSQLLFKPSAGGKKQTHPDWFPIVHILPYWLMINAVSLPFFGLLGVGIYLQQDEIKEIFISAFTEPKMWIVIVMVGSIVSFFVIIISNMWYVSTRSFLTHIRGLMRARQVGIFDKEEYRYGDLIHFSMDQIRGERLRVFLNCVKSGKREKWKGPRATPYVSFVDVSAEELKSGIKLKIPNERVVLNYENCYWEVLVETFNSSNWARFGVNIRS